MTQRIKKGNKEKWFLEFDYYDKNEDIEHRQKVKRIEFQGVTNRETALKKAIELWKTEKEKEKYTMRKNSIIYSPGNQRLVSIIMIG